MTKPPTVVTANAAQSGLGLARRQNRPGAATAVESWAASGKTVETTTSATQQDTRIAASGHGIAGGRVVGETSTEGAGAAGRPYWPAAESCGPPQEKVQASPTCA